MVALDDLLDDFPAYRQLDVRFHVGLAELTGSPRLVKQMTEIQGAMSALISHIAHPPEVLDSANDQHRRLVAALRRHDEALGRAGDDRAPARHRARARRAAAARLTPPRGSGFVPSGGPLTWGLSPPAIWFCAPLKGGFSRPFPEEGRMSAGTETLSADEQRLAELGYKQELKRGWSGFSNFAISFSIISILAGCFTTYGQAWINGGPVAISIGWPVISVFILLVAFSMAELASAMPTAGGIYYWSSQAGRRPAGVGSPAGSTSWGWSPSPHRSTTRRRRS